MNDRENTEPSIADLLDWLDNFVDGPMPFTVHGPPADEADRFGPVIADGVVFSDRVVVARTARTPDGPHATEVWEGVRQFEASLPGGRLLLVPDTALARAAQDALSIPGMAETEDDTYAQGMAEGWNRARHQIANHIARRLRRYYP